MGIPGEKATSRAFWRERMQSTFSQLTLAQAEANGNVEIVAAILLANGICARTKGSPKRQGLL
jgi:hypothetical protein